MAEMAGLSMGIHETVSAALGDHGITKYEATEYECYSNSRSP